MNEDLEPMSEYHTQLLELTQTGVSVVVLGVSLIVFLLAIMTVRHF